MNEFFKKHTDTVVVLGAIFASFLWLNSKFNQIDDDIRSLKTEIAVIKAVMILKNVMPSELASKE
jgi:hypothetical protein